MDKDGQKRAVRGAVLAVLPFWLLDLTVRIFTGASEWYPLYAPAPNLFSLGFGALFVCIALLMPRRWIGRVVYGLIYTVWLVYSVVQYSVWRIFDRFLFLSDFLFAGEGLDFTGYVQQLIDWRFVLLIALLALWGALGVLILPKLPARRRVCLRLGLLFAAAQLVVPWLYGPVPAATDWDAFQSDSYEYRRLSSPCFDMALAGPYQFITRDAMLTLLPDPDAQAKREKIDAFFDERPAHQDNEMTGLLRGKNVILVQMESVDDWVVSDENTPTIARLMREGINFSEFYTPQYTSGYTFNTEFSAQTGTYPYQNGNVAYSLSRSAFPYSIGNLFSDAGYTANSFHQNSAEFYNRGAMHRAFGYQAYHAVIDYAADEMEAETDEFMIDNDELYSEMTGNLPFLSFIITYSAHLGYDEKDALTTYALEKHPEYRDATPLYEVNGLYAKARLTDEMFERLLERLQSDDLLKDTVIVAYDDHYAYGLTDRSVLQQYSDAAGGRLLERTPAFVWYEGCTPRTVDKTLQTVDLLPTLANLFGLPAPKTLGQDAFDPDYAGCAIFANGTWLTDKAYDEKGEVKWNNGMTDAQITEMNEYASRFSEVNDAILDTDYYKNEP